MAASNTAHGEASLLGLDEFLDPDIQKILDEADLMEAVRCVRLHLILIALYTSSYYGVVTPSHDCGPSVPVVRRR